MTPAQIEELERLEREATPGPWMLGPSSGKNAPASIECNPVFDEDGNIEDARFLGHTYTGVTGTVANMFPEGHIANAEFLVALRNAAPELLRAARFVPDRGPGLCHPPNGEHFCAGCGEDMKEPHSWRECQEALREHVAEAVDANAPLRLRIAELERLAPTWISVEERLPDSPRTVLVALERKGSRFTGEAWCERDGNSVTWYCGDHFKFDGVYAWTEMPSAPIPPQLEGT